MTPLEFFLAVILVPTFIAGWFLGAAYAAAYYERVSSDDTRYIVKED